MIGKRYDIQGIRGVAIILVLLCHFFPNQFLIGYIGVDIFFVLSGFLVAMLLHRTSIISFTTIVDFYYRRSSMQMMRSERGPLR
ncbi:unnamed protein product [Nippostrongylus brasiliensis]|uniref:Acyl_transf_3 domain-containing protein n=1 Tax=Nippostrongylus brasiliensis TaxID=27835 RepID=A0A158R1U2_NIPBR|nr:unnamed protein product [Nippostrongylus brasiliensis]